MGFLMVRVHLTEDRLDAGERIAFPGFGGLPDKRREQVRSMP
jgi:hypothetical protein